MVCLQTNGSTQGGSQSSICRREACLCWQSHPWRMNAPDRERGTAKALRLTWQGTGLHESFICSHHGLSANRFGIADGCAPTQRFSSPKIIRWPIISIRLWQSSTPMCRSLHCLRQPITSAAWSCQLGKRVRRPDARRLHFDGSGQRQNPASCQRGERTNRSRGRLAVECSTWPVPSVYDAALVSSIASTQPLQIDSQGNRVPFRGAVRSNQVGGVEDALSEFDAQYSSLFGYNTTDRPRNVGRATPSTHNSSKPSMPITSQPSVRNWPPVASPQPAWVRSTPTTT